MGIVIGGISVGVTKIVYFIEDSFEKLPIHWMWWPAIGGLAVGIIGYFAPHTLGVGYQNITDVLSGSLPVQVIVNLCLLKFLSWAIALGSGTSTQSTGLPSGFSGDRLTRLWRVQKTNSIGSVYLQANVGSTLGGSLSALMYLLLLKPIFRYPWF